MQRNEKKRIIKRLGRELFSDYGSNILIPENYWLPYAVFHNFLHFLKRKLLVY